VQGIESLTLSTSDILVRSHTLQTIREGLTAWYAFRRVVVGEERCLAERTGNRVGGSVTRTAVRNDIAAIGALALVENEGLTFSACEVA